MKVKTQKISWKDYQKWAAYPSLKRLMDQAIEAGLLVIRDKPAIPVDPVEPGEPVPPPVKPPLVVDRPIFAGLTRHWSKVDPATTARMIKASGATGMSMELIELEGSEVNTPQRMTDYLLAQVRKAVPYVAELRKVGLLVKLYGFNSNASAKAQPSAAQHRQIIDDWSRRIGWRGVYVMWTNEDDANQPASVRDGAARYCREAMVKEIGEAATKAQTIAWNRPASGAAWTEYHPSRVGAWPSPGPASVIAPDNGGPLRDLGSYIGTARPNVAKWKAFAEEARKRGYGMLDAYNFNTELSQEWLNAVVKAWGAAAVTPPAPGGNGQDAIDISGFVGLGPHKGVKPQKIRITRTIKSAKITKDALSFEHDPLNWPTNSPIGDNIDGRVFVFWLEGGTLTGGHYEWRRPAQRSRDLVNIRKGYLSGKQPPKGATIWTCFVNDWIGGGKAERTNVVQCSGMWV